MAVVLYNDPAVTYAEADIVYNQPAAFLYNDGIYNDAQVAYNGPWTARPDTGPSLTLASVLNTLAGTTGLEAQGAAQVWTGTRLDLVGCLNYAAGTSGLEYLGALNRLAGTSGLGERAALAEILV